MAKNEIVLFTDGNTEIEVQISPEQETVWLAIFLAQESFMRLLSVFPTKVPEEENQRFIILI